MQYRETDFDFASRLMEEEGIYYFFSHTADGCEMVVANTPQGHADMPGAEPRSSTTRSRAATATRAGSPAGRRCQELRSGKVTLWDHCFELPHKHLEADQKIQEAVAAGTVTHKLKVDGNRQAGALRLSRRLRPAVRRHRPRRQRSRPAELQKIFEDNRRTARLRMQEEAAGAVSVEGTSTCRQLTAGHKFTLERHFDADGEYVLTRVSTPGGLWRAMATAAAVRRNSTYQNAFKCLPLALPFRPARVTPKPTVQGTQTAVVVGPAGEEIFTDKYGRVKVQFHWDREGKYDADSSCWIRVATIWAGKGWGVIHIPRIGQEVIVDFLEGDPDQPIVIGSVYNADQMPPGEPAQARHGQRTDVAHHARRAGRQLQRHPRRRHQGQGAAHVQAEYDMTHPGQARRHARR